MAIGIDATRIDRWLCVRDLDLIAGDDDANRPVQVGAMDVQTGDRGKVGERLGMGMSVSVAGPAGDDGHARSDRVEKVEARARIGAVVPDLQDVDRL